MKIGLLLPQEFLVAFPESNAASRARQDLLGHCLLAKSIHDGCTRTSISASAVMEECVSPTDKFTRLRAELRGGSLFLPGLIRALVTQILYKKIFGAGTVGGGVRII